MKPANDENVPDINWYSENEELKQAVTAAGIPRYIVEFMCKVADGLGCDTIAFFDAQSFEPPSWVMKVMMDGIPENVGVAKTTTEDECGEEDIAQMIANIRGLRNSTATGGDFTPGGKLQ